MRSHYEILGVDAAADLETIKRAWHGKVRLLHPDAHGGASDEDRASAVQEMLLANDAWEALKDPERRRRYDLQLAQLIDAATATGANATSAATGANATSARADATTDQDVRFSCPGCETPQRVSGTAVRFVCTKCRTAWRFVVCEMCHHHRTVSERWGKWSCLECGKAYPSYWGGTIKRIKCANCKSANEVALGSPTFRCIGCHHEFLRCDCGTYTSFHRAVGRFWRCPNCSKWNTRFADPEAKLTRAIQQHLDARGIDAPDAAEALAAHIPNNLDGVARVGAQGDDGVIVVAGDRAAVWWNDGRDVERLNLRDFTRIERAGRRIMLRSPNRPAICILASTDRYADGWVAHMTNLDATTTQGLPPSPGTRSSFDPQPR